MSTTTITPKNSKIIEDRITTYLSIVGGEGYAKRRDITVAIGLTNDALLVNKMLQNMLRNGKVMRYQNHNNPLWKLVST